jgi:hypothetical protein
LGRYSNFTDPPDAAQNLIPPEFQELTVHSLSRLSEHMPDVFSMAERIKSTLVAALLVKCLSKTE